MHICMMEYSTINKNYMYAYMLRKICNALIEYSFRILILETGHSTWRRGRRVVVMDLAWIFRLLNIS